MNTNANVPPPLDLNTAPVDFPLIKEGQILEFRIEKVELKTNDAGSIAIEHKTMQTSVGRDTVEVPSGATVFNNINTKPTGKATWNGISRNVAGLIQAIPGGVPGARLDNVPAWLGQLQGKVVKARVGYEGPGVNPKTGKPFRAKNTIEYYVKA